MSSRRSRFEIYVDILTEIMNGSKKPTKIMYAANLSYQPLKLILQSLLDQGLIEEEDGKIKDKRTTESFDDTTQDKIHEEVKEMKKEIKDLKEEKKEPEKQEEGDKTKEE